MTAVALNTIQLVDGSARRTLCPLISLTIQCSMGRPLSKKKDWQSTKFQSPSVPVPNTSTLSWAVYDAICKRVPSENESLTPLIWKPKSTDRRGQSRRWITYQTISNPHYRHYESDRDRSSLRQPNQLINTRITNGPAPASSTLILPPNQWNVSKCGG